MNMNVTVTIRRNRSSWRMLLVGILCFALLATPTDAKKSRKGERVIMVDEISLGTDPRNMYQDEETTVAIYNYVPEQGGSRALKAKSHKFASYSHTSDDENVNKPLAVVACGANVPKSAYRTFAEGLAKKDMVVIVVEHNVDLPGRFAGNFATPVDVTNAILYVENNSDVYGVDMQRIVLLGHSFGALVLLHIINEVCPPPLCQDPVFSTPTAVTLPLHPGVVLAGTFGFGFNLFGTDDFITFNNKHIPYIIINGSGDTTFFSTVQGENESEGTFARMAPPKVVAGIDNLDHFSISEVNTNTNRPDIMSTLDRAEQIRIVTRSLNLWIRAGLKAIETGEPMKDFCFKLRVDGMSKDYDVVKCLEEYPSE